MGRAPCCDKASVKKGPWSPEEDAKLKEYIDNFGTGGNWIALPHKAGLKRCGKSCRLRWLNYLRPNLKHGEFSDEEDMIICTLFSTIGSRWSIIAAQLPGRTDNDIKNYWNTKLKKKLMGMSNSTSIQKSRTPQIFPSSHNHNQQPSQLLSLPHKLDSNSSNIYINHPQSITKSPSLLGFDPLSFSSGGRTGGPTAAAADLDPPYLNFSREEMNNPVHGAMASFYYPSYAKQLDRSINSNNNNKLLIFGSDQTATSSCSNASISSSDHVCRSDMTKYESDQMGVHNFDQELKQKYMLSDCGSCSYNIVGGHGNYNYNYHHYHHQKQNQISGCSYFGETLMDFDDSNLVELQDDHHLVTNGSCSSSNSLLVFGVDENKTEDQNVMHFHY